MLRNRVTIVGVFVDARAEEIAECKHEIGFDWVQLHGSESPALFREFLPTVYKAIGVRRGDTMDDVLQRANAYGHGPVLLDTMVPGDMPGGTGVTFDWKIAAEVAKERLVTLAGGLTPENVAAAVAAVHPYRVDVASGVESAPGIKDRDKVRAFIAAAKVGKDD